MIEGFFVFFLQFKMVIVREMATKKRIDLQYFVCVSVCLWV